MAKTLDAAGIVAHLTGTDKGSWEPFDGPSLSDGDEFWLNEVDGCGPTEEEVGAMVAQGYVEGKGWKITTDIDLQEDDAAAEYIGKMVTEGYNSGIDPTWTIEIDNREPRQAYVSVDPDGDVKIEIGVPEERPEKVVYKTMDEIEAAPDLAAFAVEKAAAPRP